MKLAIVTDSVSDISPKIAKELNITVVPLTVIFGTDQFLDGVELSNSEFFKKLETDPNHPSTSQPSPEAFVKTYEKLLKARQTGTVAEFLANNDDVRHVVRRAFIVEQFPYSEIQDNTIGVSLVPIDMLRLKLSFFGAVKFDPRSDKWLRINMYQGAPLSHELKNSNDTWIYNALN